MNNPPSLFMRTTVWLVSLAATGALADTPFSTQPSALLTESLSLSKKRTDHGDVRTTAALRLGATMRLAGMKDAAKQALEECIALNEKDSDPDYEREEVRIELAREFLLLGMVERARSILKEAKEGGYDYDLIGQEVFARTALEMGDAAEAERAIHTALELAQRSGRKLTKTGNAMLCSLGRLALGLKKPELALQADGVVKDEIWKSVMLGDQAVTLAQQGRAEEAMRVIAPANDPHMAVLGHARVAAAILKRKESAVAVVAALLQTAAKVKSAEARDFALRVAAGKLALAGGTALAVKIAAAIQNPVTRLLALCPVVEASSFDGLMSALIACPAEDQPALAEVLTSACGAKDLAAQSLNAAAKVPQGWPRVRALCEAARCLMKTKSRDDAVKLLGAANAELSHIADAGWHCHARTQIALAAHQLGDVAMEEQQLKEACSEALRLDVAEDRRTALSQAVEAALLCGRKELAARTLTETLHSNPATAVRDTLVPLLIDAGQPDAALAEVTHSPLKDDFARRFVVYRLAKAGRLADAVDLAKKLPLRFQSEALADIALAQLKLPKPAVHGTRVVGLSLHGGWSSWVGQLEHMGVAWEVMPFSLPYLEGADGLAARYTMLGYPGAGDHHYQVSAAGEEHVRDYLREGGGLFGICAGQLLATGHQTGHQYLPSDFYYMRGQGAHQVQVAHQHPAGLGLPPVVIINRMNGDFMLPRPGCDVLGWYDKQNVCAAVSTAHYGLGRVAVSSPHPESGRELEPVDRVFIALTFWTMEGAP
jgi:tetratricopeptide (TPR) repeat protein